MCVTGIVRPDGVVRNPGARVGDAITLTKPLGIGLMTAGPEFGLLGKPGPTKVTRVMEELNRGAAGAEHSSIVGKVFARGKGRIIVER